MQLTAQNSEEQTMLDLMELRGFEAVEEEGSGYLVTPDRRMFALHPHTNFIKSAFSYFLLLNKQYP